jgi:hypothetical protein
MTDLEILKSAKATGTWQQFMIREAINMLEGNYPIYMMDFIAEKGKDHPEVQKHIDSTVATALTFATQNIKKSI